MSSWHGYDQVEDAHPERPWWQREPGHEPGEGWRRTDGELLSYSLGAWKKFGTVTMLDERDRTDPLPPPDPRCGQVWVWLETAGLHASAQQVLAVRALTSSAPRVEFVGSAIDIFQEKDWPPPGAVLVAGPGAPWAPTEPEPQAEEG
jgi:membrane-associated protease RseP (regulator of RpoE activity)